MYGMYSALLLAYQYPPPPPGTRAFPDVHIEACRLLGGRERGGGGVIGMPPFTSPAEEASLYLPILPPPPRQQFSESTQYIIPDDRLLTAD
jgi:hypothetical protein